MGDVALIVTGCEQVLDSSKWSITPAYGMLSVLSAVLNDIAESTNSLSFISQLLSNYNSVVLFKVRHTFDIYQY